MVWNDGASGLSTADKIYNYSIAKANQIITLSSNSVTLNSNNLTATVTVSGAQGSISATTSDNTIATASVSGTTVTISNVNYEDGSATISVSVTGTNNYNAATDSTIAVLATFTPDGATITPTDDIQTWLQCGSIFDKNYTTLSAVLSDISTLSTLISDNNAVDYMVRSTTWATDTCSNQTAMSYIGLNNYCANTLLANNAWLNAICNSSYFESVLNVKVPTMTDDTHPSGEVIVNGNYSAVSSWAPYKAFDNDNTTAFGMYGYASSYIGYGFITPIKCLMATVTYRGYGFFDSTSVIIKGSNDKTNWNVLLNNEPIIRTEGVTTKLICNAHDAYKYITMWLGTDSYNSSGYVFSIFEVQFYGRNDL